jgi:hypothetical protein
MCGRRFTSIILLAIFAWPVPVFGQSRESLLVAKTVAGDLRIVYGNPVKDKDRITLSGKVILEDEELSPDILNHIKRRIPPFDEVVVLHRVRGTYCNGGTFWILGLKRNGSYHISRGIGECFAHEPVVTVGNGSVKVRVRSGFGNHPLPGEPYLPGGIWLYKNGRVFKVGSGKT